MTKVKLPREAAEAIDRYRKRGAGNANIIRDLVSGFADDVLMECGTDLILEALVNGYVAERTPEEELFEYMRNALVMADAGVSDKYRMYELGKRAGVLTTLNLLGIKIGGINE